MGSACQSCPINRYSANPGACECLPCLAGTEVNDEQSACQYCLPGFFSPDGGFCQRCPIFEFAANAGAYECDVCDCGRQVNADRTGCDFCPAGSYSSNGEQ